MKEIMWYKGEKCDVEFYSWSPDFKTALIYNPQLAGKQNGVGWMSVARNKLIPYPHAEVYKNEGTTKTVYNKAKSHLKLTYAEWECTDGSVWKHEYINDAVLHQMELDKMEGDI